MTTITPAQVAWCAGVIDALGLIKTRPMKTGSELAYVGVSSARIDILEYLAKLTGVKVVTVSRNYNRLGCGEHCTEAHLHVHSTTGRWSLTGARALLFLEAIEPHLVFKRMDAKAALAAGSAAPTKPGTLKKMQELGW